MTTVLMTMTLLCIFLIIYHHLIYPYLLLLIHQRLANKELSVPPRQYSNNGNDKNLPTICIVMPAFNEQQWIADKIRNLAALDYPADRLQVIVGCDGCTDNTVRLAKQTCQEIECRHLDISINVFQNNKGKVAIINT
ncbi:MAG: glycosyltransferase, partial [Cycloclasticus sp.]